jgi:DNA-binding NtrC family response regulator
MGFDWPGNVRQLENTVYRAIVLADNPFLQPYDFPSISGQAMPMPEAVGPCDAPTAAQAFAQPFAQSLSKAAADTHDDLASLQATPVKILDHNGHLRRLEDIERDLIEHAIGVYAGHMSEVARRLGIGRSTLYRKVKDCGLEALIKDAG